jgi:hypothetical protein
MQITQNTTYDELFSSKEYLTIEEFWQELHQILMVDWAKELQNKLENRTHLKQSQSNDKLIYA